MGNYQEQLLASSMRVENLVRQEIANQKIIIQLLQEIKNRLPSNNN